MNGVTVQDVSRSGIVVLERDTTVPEERYHIVMPLILLRSLNMELKLVPDDLLASMSYVDSQAFERFLLSAFMIRNNALVRKKYLESDRSVHKDDYVCSVSYGDLFPSSLAHPETLAKQVGLRWMCGLAAANGESSKHDSAHYHTLAAMPLVGGDRIDLRLGRHMLMNVEKAPSFDGLSVHPADSGVPMHASVFQFKPSEAVQQGELATAQFGWNVRANFTDEWVILTW